MTIKNLKSFLTNVTPGPISDTSKLQTLLIDCWNEFSGSTEGGMKAYKLSGRIEQPTWKSPLLSFKIERHGGTVMGSSRAEIQRWTINIALKTTTVTEAGYRQLYPQQAPWTKAHAAKAAQEVSELINQQSEDELVTWLKNGGVRVMIGTIVPDDAAAQTVTGRRKRFWKCLDEILGPDWSRAGAIYKKMSAP